VVKPKCYHPRNMDGMLFGECEIGEINGEPTGEVSCPCNGYVDRGWFYIRFSRLIYKIHKRIEIEWFNKTIMKDTSKIPSGMYCYTPKHYDKDTGIYDVEVCPYYWNNPLGIGDCSFISPKWKFWQWNGWKHYDPALDDQCKACKYNKF